MRSLLIAAGMGRRLAPLTNDLPKSLLPFRGSTNFQIIVDHCKNLGAWPLTVITGHASHRFTNNEVSYVHNGDFQKNNILHSMMKARQFINETIEKNEDLIVSYSDIYYDRSVLQNLIKDKSSDLLIVVDPNWKALYIDRAMNPITEGEKFVYSRDGYGMRIGKDIDSTISEKDGEEISEFIGLLKLTPKALSIWVKEFDQLMLEIDLKTPFIKAKEWQQSYLTDFMQYMINKKSLIPKAHKIVGRWLEFDTVEDYEKLLKDFTI